MKATFALLLCLYAFLANAQQYNVAKLQLDPGTHLITYTELVRVVGASQQELLARAPRVLASNSTRDITIEDEGKQVTSKLRYSVRLLVLNDSYRYEIDGFSIQERATPNWPTPQAIPVESFMAVEIAPIFRYQIDQERQQLLIAAQEIADSIKAAMMSKDSIAPKPSAAP